MEMQNLAKRISHVTSDYRNLFKKLEDEFGIKQWEDWYSILMSDIKEKK